MLSGDSTPRDSIAAGTGALYEPPGISAIDSCPGVESCHMSPGVLQVSLISLNSTVLGCSDQLNRGGLRKEL